MKQVLFVRHARSVTNDGAHWADGPATIPLAPQGRIAAQAFADHWSQPTPDLILASPYQRTIDTAQPLAGKFGLELQIRDDLREFTFWDFKWHLATYEARRAEARQYWDRMDPQEKAGGTWAESFEECLDRARQLTGWLRSTDFHFCVCVSHGFYMHILRGLMRGEDQGLTPQAFMQHLHVTLPGMAYRNLDTEVYWLPRNCG